MLSYSRKDSIDHQLLIVRSNVEVAGPSSTDEAQSG